MRRSPPELTARKQISVHTQLLSYSFKVRVRHVMVMVKVWLGLQEMNESHCNAALLTCFGVFVCVCVHARAHVYVCLCVWSMKRK